MALYEELYGRRCRTLLCWYESGESVVLGPDIVKEMTGKIRMICESMKDSQSRQKSYHDKRREALEFQVDDHVFMRVTSLKNLHDVFHVSKSRKHVPDPSHVIQMDDIHVRDNLTIKASPVRIEGREVKQLRGKDIALVNVLWGGLVGESLM
ncbi:uncharacterized protein LOC131634364 [Vicia villosa]|uniref:uncharacterized protein LOC131634364 n=1 Tax=Vicia villosa TaxID=3911 RepID=UPI00273CE45B|nr:uncharacterized protein LOC131634364 [Vicia villosa]